MSDDTPKRWPHSCEFCTHLGRLGPDDLYFCALGERSVAVRFGPWADEYRHMSIAHARRQESRRDARGLPRFWAGVALERAEQRGLLGAAA